MEMHPRPVDVLVRAAGRRELHRADSQLDAAVAELLKATGQAVRLPYHADSVRSRLIARSIESHSSLPRLAAAVAAPLAAQARRETPAAVQRYFDLTRPLFSGDRAYDQVAFMDQYFRWPGNTGFNASIRRVEDILKAAGYVEESKREAGATR